MNRVLKSLIMIFKKHFLVIFLIFILFFSLFGDIVFSEVNRALLPSALVSVGSGHAVVVDKSGQKIYVFKKNEDGIEKVFEAECSTGMNGGSKEKRGDGRTPEGIYFATDRYTERELSSTYGTMAFNLNYPNYIDHRKGRTGHNIWIHGTDSDLRPFQSNGCVTLADEDIRILSGFVRLNETPIIILDRVQWVSRDLLSMGKEEFAGIINIWQDCLREGKPDGLADIYEERGLVDMEGLGKLAYYLRSWKSKGMDVSFHMDNVSILRHERYAVISFNQVVSYRDRSWGCGSRMLFLGRDNGRWFISGDVLQNPASNDQLADRLERVNAVIEIYADVRDMIHKWKKSWQSGDFEDYATHYASDFKALGMNRSQWLEYKKKIAKINKNITIETGDLDIIPGSRKTRVSFYQRYMSSAHSDEGIKTLLLKKKEGRWKIYREIWEEL